MLDTDPHGKSQHEPGAKLDDGKITMALSLGYFYNALGEVNKVSLFGAEKYTPFGWTEVPDGINRYTEADLRHIASELSGEELDNDSKLRHASHHAWNSLARLELIIRRDRNA
tara:strand:- start:615 stop:953 length:339 start_codon:yes stop_codon:yes gene_type:complete